MTHKGPASFRKPCTSYHKSRQLRDSQKRSPSPRQWKREYFFLFPVFGAGQQWQHRQPFKYLPLSGVIFSRLMPHCRFLSGGGTISFREKFAPTPNSRILAHFWDYIGGSIKSQSRAGRTKTEIENQFGAVNGMERERRITGWTLAAGRGSEKRDFWRTPGIYREMSRIPPKCDRRKLEKIPNVIISKR